MRGVDTRNEEEQQEGHVRTQWEGRPSASQGERPHGNKPPSTLTVDFQPLRLWEGEFLLLGPPSLRYSVTAAWADLLLRLLLYSTLSTPVHLSKFQFPCFHCRGTWSSQKKKKREFHKYSVKYLELCLVSSYTCTLSCSAVSDSLWPHGLWPTRLLWKSTEVSRQEYWGG